MILLFISAFAVERYDDHTRPNRSVNKLSCGLLTVEQSFEAEWLLKQ